MSTDYRPGLLDEPDERAVLEAMRRLGCDTAPVAWVLHFNDPDPQTDIEFCRECPAGWIGKAEPLYEGPGVRPYDARRALARLAWLHSSGSHNVGGYEWGIYRVKWVNGRAAEVWQTDADFSDLDAAMGTHPALASASEPVHQLGTPERGWQHGVGLFPDKCASASVAGTSESLQAMADNERDATRYHNLRTFICADEGLTEEEFDSAVDAAIEERKSQPTKETK